MVMRGLSLLFLLGGLVLQCVAAEPGVSPVFPCVDSQASFQRFRIVRAGSSSPLPAARGTLGSWDAHNSTATFIAYGSTEPENIPIKSIKFTVLQPTGMSSPMAQVAPPPPVITLGTMTLEIQATALSISEGIIRFPSCHVPSSEEPQYGFDGTLTVSGEKIQLQGVVKQIGSAHSTDPTNVPNPTLRKGS
jgi:hypothetical protein